jgi:hypothetical protein
MPKRFLTYSRSQPARTILAVAAVLSFLAGIFIFTPWYVPVGVAPAVSTVLQVSHVAGGVVTIAVAGFALWCVKNGTPCWISRGAFALFLWYLLIALTRMLFANPLSLTWLLPFTVAMILSVIYIEQRFICRRDA